MIQEMFIWLCGIWSFGLGIRIVYEFTQYDYYILIPKIPLNIYFDFIPLAAFGFITIIIFVYNGIKTIRSKR